MSTDPKRALREWLNDWRGWGVDTVPSKGGTVATKRVEAGGLEALRAEVAACRKCGLCETRTQTVFCSGEPAPLMFIGEAPGADEDAKGEAFVGRAGQLLTKILDEVGIGRKKVYIANVLKCRPPDNRPPEPAEVAACRGFLERQIELVNPKVICALGKHAAQWLLGWEGPMKAVLGTWKHAGGRWLTATYHPSYLLRNPPDTDIVRMDLKGILAKLRELEAT